MVFPPVSKGGQQGNGGVENCGNQSEHPWPGGIETEQELTDELIRGHVKHLGADGERDDSNADDYRQRASQAQRQIEEEYFPVVIVQLQQIKRLGRIQYKFRKPVRP